jgi:hypothetical protein
MTSSTAHANVRVRYGAAAEAISEDDAFRLRLSTDGLRSPAALVARLAQPAIVRDALATMGDILRSDLRFKAQDRADYLAYLQGSGKKVTQQLWDAQKAFLEHKYSEAADEEQPLEPLLCLDQHGLALEVFSADESAYARLTLHAGEAYEAEQLAAGTTYLPIDDALTSALARMRSYRASTLELVPSDAGGRERALRVPYRWIRAFGQVQAASTLPAQRFELAPVDLYNVLLTLRMRKAKTPPRALRYELVPGEAPKLVLEPWDLVLDGTGPVYEGARPMVVRTWGRKRLQVLARLLPHAKRVSVHLVGAGLPAFYVVELPGATLTLALSGWTDSGWAGISTFDLLVAQGTDDVAAQKVRQALEAGPKSLPELVETSGRKLEQVRQALLAEIQLGRVVHDLPTERFVWRELTAESLDSEKLRFRDAREEEAHRLLAVKNQVRLVRIHDLGAEGVRIEGEVDDKQAHRSYKTSFTLDREGRTVDASCTSPEFRRAGLREGPTAPMIAVRLLYARQQAELERARGTEKGRKLIRAETRTLLRRERQQATYYRVSLDERQVVVRWGPRLDQLRAQRLFFGTPEDARADYFGRLERLTTKGFIDSSAGEQL